MEAGSFVHRQEAEDRRHDEPVPRKPVVLPLLHQPDHEEEEGAESEGDVGVPGRKIRFGAHVEHAEQAVLLPEEESPRSGLLRMNRDGETHDMEEYNCDDHDRHDFADGERDRRLHEILP